MTTTIQFVKMPSSQAMTEFITKKLQKLQEKFPWIQRVEVYFKLENDAAGRGKICEIELGVPGARSFASSTAGNFEAAAMKTLQEVERLMEKRKAVMLVH